jgi:hypothetical protein
MIYHLKFGICRNMGHALTSYTHDAVKPQGSNVRNRIACTRMGQQRLKGYGLSAKAILISMVINIKARIVIRMSPRIRRFPHPDRKESTTW